MEPETLHRTAQHWDDEGGWEIGRGRFWLELPAVQRRMNEKVSGSPTIGWTEHTINHYFAERLPLGRCLSLGCGHGALERMLAAAGVFVACDAFDISQKSLQTAGALAAAAGITNVNYVVGDINTLELPRNAYDAVWIAGAAHHFADLDHVFAMVRSALKPSGLLILNEYVGANRFQFGRRQRELIEACHALIPDHFRRLPAPAPSTGDTPVAAVSGWSQWQSLAQKVNRTLAAGDIGGAVRRKARQWQSVRIHGAQHKVDANLPTLQAVMAVDPSEAVRSSDILPVVDHFFDIVELRPMGGAILQFLLADIAGNFTGATGTELLGMFFQIEDALMVSGELGSDFVFVVASPRRGSADEEQTT